MKIALLERYYPLIVTCNRWTNMSRHDWKVTKYWFQHG